ncbi:hypothetical protein LCGC14_2877240 [marine sediment metagenome]|uniref:Uncharacterized protein n=1 Tax=marine sediment metagenome TaxID=412755 RepID=A0A0F8Y1C7_9ZZZZ
MKTAIFILLLAFCSCNKCVECTTKTITTVNVPSTIFPQVSFTYFDFCGTNSEIKQVEGKLVSQSTTQGITATVEMTTTCY